MSVLPLRPSREQLRKEAKRLARERSLPLSRARYAVARTYGFKNWPELLRHVAALGDEASIATLFEAVRAGDVAVVTKLLASGANPRVGNGRQTPLHAAARRGPVALVETLLAGGAIEWQPDAAGRTALDVARRSRARDRSAIIALLDRTSITDASFRAAVTALQAGDVAELSRLLDTQPRLLHDRILGSEVYRVVQRHQYFLDPKLFWFIANNPILVDRMAPNITEIAQLMIDRGVSRVDLDYALELVMSSKGAREQGHQLTLMHVLFEAGATATRQAIFTAAGYRELDALRVLLDAGQPLSAPIAAALGQHEALRRLLSNAHPDEVQAAFGFAIINGQLTAARLALAGGADVNAFLPVHAHSTALHTAALDGRVDMIEMLFAHGALNDTHDLLWNGTPLDWAHFAEQPLAQAALERRR